MACRSGSSLTWRVLINDDDDDDNDDGAKKKETPIAVLAILILVWSGPFLLIRFGVPIGTGLGWAGLGWHGWHGWHG